MSFVPDNQGGAKEFKVAEALRDRIVARKEEYLAGAQHQRGNRMKFQSIPASQEFRVVATKIEEAKKVKGDVLRWS